MNTSFFILMSIAMMAVLGILIVGVLGMARGGDFNRKYGNRLMQARLLMQAIALGFFVLAILMAKK